jgi:hypothetical protein
VALGVTLVRRPILTEPDQLKQIGPLERVAAGEHHEGFAKRTDLVQQAVALLGRQFGIAALGLCRRAAMYAGKVAGLCGFPDHQHRGLVEVHGVSPFLDVNGLQFGCHGVGTENRWQIRQFWSCLSFMWGISRSESPDPGC